MATQFTPNWSADLEYRLRERFPHDLAGQAVYIVTHRDIGRDFSFECSALYATMLDLQISQALKARGTWQGPGFATFIKDWIGFDSLGDEGRWAIVLHEFCHWLDLRNKEPVELASRPEFADFVAKIFEPRERKGGFIPLEYLATPWDGHELRFHRAALHVADRAGLTDLEPMGVFERYGLSSPDEYRAAFAGEFGTTLRVRDILDLPVPQAAADLFAADQARWKPDTQPAAVSA